MKMTQSRFYCTQCGNEGIPLMRKAGQQRESGHLKKLFCIYCNKEVNHAEIRDSGGYTYEDFKKEFELGRFVDGQRENMSSCTCLKCQYNINGKCWNSNNSANCPHKPKK